MVVGEGTTYRSNVIHEVVMPSALGTERSTKQEIYIQQVADGRKVARIPYALVKIMNKFRRAHANQPIQRSRFCLVPTFDEPSLSC